MAKEITDGKKIEELMKSQSPVAIFFFWDKCGHCEVMQPVWDEVAKETPSMEFVKIESANIPQKLKDTGDYGSFPKFVVVKDGKARATTLQGELAKEDLKKTLLGGRRRRKTLRRGTRRLTRKGLKRRH
jgi:thiol-disulfide isomerase/thioredoxin